MKKFRTGIYLVVLLLASCASFAAGKGKAMSLPGICHSVSLFDESELTIDLPAPESKIHNRLGNFEDKEFAFQSRFKKKYKPKYLVQQRKFSHYIKKPDRQVLLQDIEFLQERHVVAPANDWLIRPAYYTFLFRLYPF